MPTYNPGLSGAAPIAGNGVGTLAYLTQRPSLFVRGIEDVFAQNYWADRLLPNAGAVTGGSVQFQVVDNGDNFLTRDVEDVAEGSEVPLLTSAERDFDVATATEFAGGIVVTDTALRRNELLFIQREQAKLGNNMNRKVHRDVVAAIDKAVTTYNRTVPVGVSWKNLVANDNDSQSNFADWPHMDIVNAQAAADVADNNLRYNILLAHPLERANLLRIYDGDLSRLWVDQPGTVIATNLVPLGSPILAAEGQVGQTRWELPIRTEKVDERRKRRTVWQTEGSAVHYVDQPQAVVQFSGSNA